MHSLLITVLLCYGFHQHCCVHGRYTIPHLNSYNLPFMADANVSGLQLNRRYLVNPAVKLRCAWNTTTPSGLQDSLLLDMDYNTLTCQPGTVVKSPSGSAGMSTFSSLNATDLAAFGRNLAVTAYLQNGSSNYQFPLQFVGNATFSVPLNRSVLSTDRGTPGLPWEVQVYASVQPPTLDYSVYFKNTFTIVDPFSDAYYAWDYGDPTDWLTVAATQSSVVYNVKNPCANQVTLFIIPAAQNVVYIGKSYLKSLDPTGMKWYKTTIGNAAVSTCKVTGVAGYVRYILLQTDLCGYFVTNPLAPDVFAAFTSLGGAGAAFNATAGDASQTGPKRVNFTHVDPFGTAAGLGYGSLANGGAGAVFNVTPGDVSQTGPKRVKFTHFGTTAGLSYGSLANGGSGGWCYLRKNLQPTGDATVEPVNTEEPSDWISFKDSTTSQWSLTREPFNDTPRLFPAIRSYQFNNSLNPRMNAAYSQRLFADLKAQPSQIVSAYMNSPTSTYYFLYKNQQAQNPVYALYSQALSDTLNSLPTARLIYKFPVSLTAADTPTRIVSHPTSTDLFVLSPAVAWLLTSNGLSLKKIFDIRKSDPAPDSSSPPPWTIDNMLFGQNGTLSYFTAKSSTAAGGYKVYRGNSYYGGYLPLISATNPLSPALLITALSSASGLLVDGSGGLHSLSVTNSPAFSTLDKLYLSVDQTSLNAAGVAIPTPLLSQEFLTGTFSVVPFTRKFFMIVEWTTVAAAATHVGQFTPADIGRILVQQNLADATLKPGQAHIVGYNTFDQAVTAQWASTNAPQMVPFSYISMEAVAAFQYDATVATTYQGQQLSVQFNADRSVALTSNASLPLNAAVFAEQFNADGSLAYRGSWLVVSALSGTVYQATELLGYTAPSDLSPVTFLPGQWKVFSLSSPTAGAPVTSWYLQDHWYCPYEFVANQSTIGPWDHHMDRGHVWNLTVLLRRARGGLPSWEVPRKSKGTFVPNHLLHEAGNPWRLHVRSDLMGDGFAGWNLSYHIEEVGSDFNLDNAVTSLSFRIGNPTQGCGISAAVPVTVISGCLRGSGLTYAYPDGAINATEWNHPGRTNKIGDFIVGPIPVNYRPPSAAGVAFPTSRILYNSDETQPYLKHFSDHEGHKPDFGCTAAHPYNCVPSGTCTDAQRGDPSIINCINRTVYLPFSGDHYFRLHDVQHFSDSGPLDPAVPLRVNELNGRVDFTISTPPADIDFVLQLLQNNSNYAGAKLYSSNLTIQFTGTGLYHFQVQPAFDYSYCNQSVYFTLWLYSAALPFPMEQVCLCFMGLIVALWLFHALRVTGEATLIDYRRYTASRPPDRVPLHDVYVDAEDWDEIDLEAEVEAMDAKRVIPVEEDAEGASKSNIVVD